MDEQILSIIQGRLNNLGSIISNIDCECAQDDALANITLTVEQLESSTATILNQTAVLVISQLSEVNEDSKWCVLTSVELDPISGGSLTMKTKFSIKGRPSDVNVAQ